MNKQIIQYFISGVMGAFTISVLIISIVTTIISNNEMIPVSLIWQALFVSVLCSLINFVYRSEKLKFIWQCIIGYILTAVMITICALTFNWYGYGENGFSTRSLNLIFITFLIYSSMYLFVWIILWQKRKTEKKELNNKLNEYKSRQ